MKTFQNWQTDYGVDTKNTSTANLTAGMVRANDFYRRLLAKHDWPFLHRQRTMNTQNGQDFVNLPYDVDLVESVSVTVGSTKYVPRLAPTRKFWDELHYNTYTSNIPRWAFVYNGQLGLWPQSGTGSSVIALDAKIRVVDLSITDTTNFTISNLAIGSTNLVLATGTMTSQFVGFWIRPTQGTVTNTGDGVWYEISSVTSGTQISLVRAYGGAVSISSSTASCTIGQVPLLPEAFQDLPEIYAAWRYWLKEDDKRAAEFKKLLDGGISDMEEAYGVNDLSMVVDDGDPKDYLNPNLTLTL